MCICSRAPHCRTVVQVVQRKTHRKHLPRSNLSSNTRQDCFKIPSLYQTRSFFLKVILESNVTPNISKSSDSFSTVPPIVYGGDWGCTVSDLETIIALVLFAFNLIPQMKIMSFDPCGLVDQNSANVCSCACRKRRLIMGYKLSYTTGLLYAWCSCMQ